jgi:hypothetical protein
MNLMSLKNILRLGVLLAAMAIFATTAAAQGSCSSCTTVSSNLTLSATAETAIQLVISTGSGGATVTDGGSGAYTVPFGNVNGLGIGTPAAGINVSASGSGATYTTPINVTPNFSGFANTTATVKVYQDATTSANSQSAAREGSAAGSVASVPTTSGSANTVSATASTATAITRYVGVFVSNVNGGSAVTGSLAPKFIYSVTVN